jgi:hypothetical protein
LHLSSALLEGTFRRDVEHYAYNKWKEKGRRKDEEGPDALFD